MDVKAMDLYEAYKQNMLPKDEGYVISGFFMSDTPYTILEIISYSEVKNFYSSGDSITFQSNGKKIYILVEPTTYTMKAQEPYVRPSKFQIPLRFHDLEIYTCRNQYKIMYSKEPQMVMTSFTILKPSGLNFSFIVFAKPGIQDTLSSLLQKTFNQNANIPLADSKKVSDTLADKVVKELSWPNKEGARKVKTKAAEKANPESVDKTTATKKAEPVLNGSDKAKPAAKAKAEPKAKTAVKAKAAPKAGAKAAAKPAKAKAEPKAKAAKPAAKAESKAKTAAKPASKAKAEPKAKTAVKAKASPKAAAKPAKAKAEPKAKAAKPAAKAKPAVKTAAKPAAKAKAEPKAKTAVKAKTSPKAAAKPAKAKAEPKAKAAKPAAKPAAKTKAEPKAKAAKTVKK